ncbi:MAG: DnaD domain protein [Bacilli bacterium]
MKELTILPADLYTVVNKSDENYNARKVITMLYQPIIGYTAVSLYFTLVDDLDKSSYTTKALSHHHLMTMMQLKLDDIIIARKKLEAVGLLKTYFKEDNLHNYIYVIYSPMSVYEFLNHPILNVVLYNNIGKSEYDIIVDYYKVPRINLKEYEDITSSFNQVFTPISGNILIDNDNVIKSDSLGLSLSKKLDFDLIISSLPKNMYNEKCFNDTVKELIISLSFVYNIDELQMQGIIRNCLNEKGLIEKTELRKNCRNFYQFENNNKLPTLIYSKQPEYLKIPQGDSSKRAKMINAFETITPYDYLKSKYKTGSPSISELKIIESLMIDLGLRPGVVNVLIDYVLRINNQKLNKAYITTIAGQWNRLKIETVEDAMKVAEKEHKKLKNILVKSNYKPNNNESNLPIWFNKNLEKEELTKDEEKELNDIMKEFS